jgi:hypothetical protein
MAMYSFVPPFREAKFCGMPSCVFDKLEKSLRNTALDRRLGGSQGQPGRSGKNKNPCPCCKSNPGRVAFSQSVYSLSCPGSPLVWTLVRPKLYPYI